MQSERHHTKRSYSNDVMPQNFIINVEMLLKVKKFSMYI